MLYIRGLISRLADPSGLGCGFCWLQAGRMGRSLGLRGRCIRLVLLILRAFGLAVLQSDSHLDSNSSAFAAAVRIPARCLSDFAAQSKFWIVRLRCRGRFREDSIELLCSFDVLQVSEFREVAYRL